MDFYSLSDTAIESELGHRLRALRLKKNLTQKELADATQLSLNTIKALEKGQAKLATVIATLRELGALDQLNQFIPEAPISPLQLHKLRGRQRERASGERVKKEGDESEW